MSFVRAHRVVAAATVLAALLIALIATGGPAAAATEHQIGTFNMGGGHADHGTKGDEAPDALVASILDRRPAFVALQEACRDWTERLGSRLPGYTVVFDPVSDGSGATPDCRHPSEFGNAIVYRDDFGVDGGPVAHSLGSPAGLEQREMLCVTASSRATVLCSAHLSSGGDDTAVGARASEAGAVRSILEQTYPGLTVLLGGDFNAEPDDDELDALYHDGYGRGATGTLKEVDSPCGDDLDERGGFPLFPVCRAGEDTIDDWDFGEEGSPLGAKLDYIFVTPSVEVIDADATFGIHSDHDPLWADILLP